MSKAEATLTTFKVCSKCAAEKPATINFFRSYNSTKQALLRNRCRLCEGLRFEGTYRARKRLPEEERQRRNKMRCSQYYAANRNTLIKKMRLDRQLRPEDYRRSSRKSYLKHKSAGSDYQKRRYAKLDKAKARADIKRWRVNNPEKAFQHWRKTYEKNKAKILQRALLWAKKNPLAIAAIRDRRRAKELGVASQGNYTKDDIRLILKSQGRFCFYCSGGLKKFHADHFIPLSRGGTNRPDNIVLSCPTCNFSKGGKLPWEWKPERFKQESNAWPVALA